MTCTVPHCGNVAEGEFCPPHWKRIPKVVRNAICDERRKAKHNRQHQLSKHWAHLVASAAVLLEMEDTKAKGAAHASNGGAVDGPHQESSDAPDTAHHVAPET